MPSPSPSPPPWHAYLTIDLFAKVLSNSIFHPFIACLIPLCFRATNYPYESPEFIYTTGWAFFLVFLNLLSPINNRLAYGKPRNVDLEEEVIVITGGASGLGACLAEIYAMRGATVAVLDIQDESQRTTTTEGVNYYTCDVGLRPEVETAWKKIVEDLGTPTVLINNAAIVHGKSFLDLTPEDIDRTFRTNTQSHYTLTSLFLPPLLTRPTGGTFVTISSVLGTLGASHLCDYSASKAALTAFHASLTSELSSTHPTIKTILVASGQLSTDLFRGVELDRIGQFFGPVVEVQNLAMKIVGMVDAGRGGVIAEPAYARWIAWLGILPIGLQKVLRRWAVDTAMAGFREKKKGLNGNGHGPAKNEKIVI